MINEKKDACYHKVKSRYKVWPSAYASGALVKCRKKGAKNWGSSVKESILNTYSDLAYVIAERARWKKELENGPKLTISGDELTMAEVDTLRKGPKNIVKDKRGRIVGPRGDIPGPKPPIPQGVQKLFRQYKFKNKATATNEAKKGVMPKMKMGVHKSRAGGLTKKGVAAYRAANPGSKLKTAVTTKPSKLKKGSKSAKRRKSFCARMGGMKKRLTSAKTASDPNSRINKALRKWNC